MPDVTFITPTGIDDSTDLHLIPGYTASRLIPNPDELTGTELFSADLMKGVRFFINDTALSGHLDRGEGALLLALAGTPERERPVMLAWAENLGRNVYAYGDEHDITRAFKNAFMGIHDRQAFLKEHARLDGTPETMMSTIDWNAYQSRLPYLMISLPSGDEIGIINPDL